jgi:hypothetical protein
MEAMRKPFRNMRKYRFLKRFFKNWSEILEIIFLLILKDLHEAKFGLIKIQSIIEKQPKRIRITTVRSGLF